MTDSVLDSNNVTARTQRLRVDYNERSRYFTHYLLEFQFQWIYCFAHFTHKGTKWFE